MKIFLLLRIVKSNFSMPQGKFIIIDGIDGCGKSTILEFWVEFLRSQNKKIFCLKDYWKEHGKHPLPEELQAYDVIVSAEPTYVWTGAAIRQELIRNGTGYSARTIAEAYALDRLILYTRLLLPLRAQGKMILQDRSVSTSLCYQSVQEGGLPQDEIAAIEGNAFALLHAPDHLVLTHMPIENAMARVGVRTDKKDDALFEKTDFLTRAQDCFLSQTYQAYFTSRGTKIHLLNCDVSLDIIQKESLNLFDSLFI